VHQALAVYLARQLNEMEVFKIQQVFNAIDKNQAGFIEHSIILEGSLLTYQQHAKETLLFKSN
jgi:hypothetical protein